ncbi:MAG: hypothetical protein ACFCU5_17530 [Pleurocapsa sp.]
MFKFSKNQGKLGIELIWQIFAAIVLTSLFLKAIIDVDVNYDSWWYHLPFSARVAGIVPPELFLGDERWSLPRFAGFPLLAHSLQGFLWLISGRVQTANLVCYLSLIVYLIILKTNFQIPLYLSAIALLSIPLVLTHTTTCLVDLPGNIGFSVVLMLTHKLFAQKQLPTKTELLIATLAAATAANTKTLLQPLVFIVLIIFLGRLSWLYQQSTTISIKNLGKTLSAVILACLLIFATPVKNTVVYGNPLYPIKIEIAGIVLNHELVPDAYAAGNRRQKWLRSLLEIQPAPWSAEQSSQQPRRDRMGGFFGAYVIFNLLLLLSLSLYELLAKNCRSVAARTALAIIMIISIIVSGSPQSHELRYFMCWMISLVSLNLSLIARGINSRGWRWFQPKYMGIVYATFLTIVLTKIHHGYLKPSFHTLDQQITKGVKQEFLSQIQPNEQVCLISRHVENPQKASVASLKYVFLYSSYFHPELGYSYSVRAAFDPENCGDRKIIQ